MLYRSRDIEHFKMNTLFVGVNALSINYSNRRRLEIVWEKFMRSSFIALLPVNCFHFNIEFHSIIIVNATLRYSDVSNIKT